MNKPNPKPGIMEINPYEGGRSKIDGLNGVIKLSSNESAVGASARAIEAYRSCGNKLHIYPDGGATELRAAIGCQHDLDPISIVCGAGSDELFYNLARAYAGPGDEVLYSEHGFNIYPIVARAVGANPITAPEKNLTFDVDAILAKVTNRTKIVFIANPNNPTGSYISTNELTRLRGDLPGHILLVIDGAYAEYVDRPDYTDGRTLVENTENTVMTRTFSKIYGLAALRIGWGYCPPKIADILNRLRAPFNLTSAAQAAGVAALEDTEHLTLARTHNATWLPWLTEKLTNLGLKVYPSVTNFVLVRFPLQKGRRAGDANEFLGEHGIIPRETVGYGLPSCLRITVGTEMEVRTITNCLSEFVESWKD